jgi:hypothetical protein
MPRAHGGAARAPRSDADSAAGPGETDDWRSSVDTGSDLDDHDNVSLDGRSTLAADRSVISHEGEQAEEARMRSMWQHASDTLNFKDGCAPALHMHGMPSVAACPLTCMLHSPQNTGLLHLHVMAGLP